MNRFNKRVKALYKKTHIFISYQELRDMRDSYRSRVNDAGFEPEDLSAEVKNFLKSLEESNLSEREAMNEIGSKILNETPAIFYADLFFNTSSYFENNPNGVWLDEETGKLFACGAKIAKKYLADKNKKPNP